MTNDKETAIHLRQVARSHISQLDMHLQEYEAFGNLLGDLGKSAVEDDLNATINALKDIADHHGIDLEATR